MKLTAMYVVVMSIGLSSFASLIGSQPSPEDLVQGSWKEVSWEYERVDSGNESNRNLKNIIKQNLIIHKAENWTFLSKGILKLSGNNSKKVLTWRIKGRGNILQLKYEDHSIENYNVTKLDKDEMQLNFETEVHARGIAKLTFKKIKG